MKTALITGGSGGIGRACAIKLALDGYAVVINYYNNEKKAEDTVRLITEKGGVASAYRADVTDINQVKKMMRDVATNYGGIDVLVNNAGMVKDGYLLTVTPETLDKCISLNVKGYYYCAQQAVLKMFRKKSGIIINMSSISSLIALEGQSVYTATKGAVNAMTVTLAKELAPMGIRVNAVAPGFVETDMLDTIPEEKKKEYLNTIPMHRFCKAKEVAEVVSALCSDAFSYVTGQIIVLDGGLSL